MHGIVEINRDYATGTDYNITNEQADAFVGTGRDLSLQSSSNLPLQTQANTAKIKSLSELMGAYKTTSSKQIHLVGLFEFKWQRSFHDHIIRDEKSFESITNYIESNSRNWPEDTFYKK